MGGFFVSNQWGFSEKKSVAQIIYLLIALDKENWKMQIPFYWFFKWQISQKNTTEKNDILNESVQDVEKIWIFPILLIFEIWKFTDYWQKNGLCAR